MRWRQTRVLAATIRHSPGPRAELFYGLAAPESLGVARRPTHSHPHDPTDEDRAPHSSCTLAMLARCCLGVGARGAAGMNTNTCIGNNRARDLDGHQSRPSPRRSSPSSECRIESSADILRLV